MLPLLTRIDHVGIACRDLEAAIGLYTATFGLEVASLELHEEQGVREAMLRVGAARGAGAAAWGRRARCGAAGLRAVARAAGARHARWASSSPAVVRASTMWGMASATSGRP